MKEIVSLVRTPMIFIAEDDKDDLYFMKTALREIDPGQEIRNFSNGQQLLDALKEMQPLCPAFILLDLNMPVLDGRETLRLLRQSFGSELPVVIFTTSNHHHERELCMEYGASAYRTKPLTYQQYLETLRELRSEWMPALAMHLN